jgi:hypothetical protein
MKTSDAFAESSAAGARPARQFLRPAISRMGWRVRDFTSRCRVVLAEDLDAGRISAMLDATDRHYLTCN